MLAKLVIFMFVGLCLAQDPVAPDNFVVNFTTSKGLVTLNVTRAWSPYGVDRFYALVQDGYYSQNAFFRVISNFVAQWGIAADPAVSAKWENANIPNDPVVKSNTRGYVSFAAAMDNNNQAVNRTTQLYINYIDNSRLDQYGFSPFAFVTVGMDVVDQFYAKYGENPDQSQIYSDGNKYLQANFPLLDYLVSAVVV